MTRRVVYAAIAAQRRATAPGEDHNYTASLPPVKVTPAQRRATAPGEDHNSTTVADGTCRVVSSAGPPRPARITTGHAGRRRGDAHRAAPGHRARRGSQLTRQHRVILDADSGSAGPPRPARITTDGRRPCGRLGGRGSAGPPRPARITTPSPRPASRPGSCEQRRATAPGEDHNSRDSPCCAPPAACSAGPPRPARITTPPARPCQPAHRLAAPGHRARRGSQPQGVLKCP